jgi:HPt (histidine-containing phosphotransfer) domain-containing protein
MEWLKHLHSLENIIGNETFRYAIVSFLFEAPRYIKKLDEALEESDFTSFHQHTSFIRSAAANVGAKKMVLLCKELDMTLQVHYVETVKRIIKELQQEFVHVKDFLESEFKLKSNETVRTN